MNKQEIARRKIVKYIFLIYWIMIFEGAVRKWLFPQLNELIFFLRDPFVLLTYLIAFRNNIFTRDRLLTSGIVIALLFIPLIFIQVMVNKINVLALIYGWRCYFLYLPFAFVIKDTMRHEDIHKLFKHALYISIPLAVLAYIQFISPRDSFINNGYGGGDAFVVSGLIVRTTGTFSFTAGQTMYAASLMAMLVFIWLYRTRFNILSLPSLIVTTITSLTTLLVTGSRTAFFMTGLIVAGTFIGLLFTKETKQKFTGTILLVFLILVGTVMFLGPLKKSFDATTARFEQASASEGSSLSRAIAPLMVFTRHVLTAPVIGEGLGVTSGGGTKLAFGKAKWFLAEDEWSRHLVEAGPGFGLIYIFYRIFFTFVLARQCLNAARKDNNILPMILFGFIGFYLLAGQIASVGGLLIYNWIFVGLVMAAVKKQQSEIIPPKYKPAFPNIVGSK